MAVSTQERTPSENPYIGIAVSCQSEPFPLNFTCTLLALLRKSLIINEAGEGNRTLVTYLVVKSGGEWF